MIGYREKTETRAGLWRLLSWNREAGRGCLRVLIVGGLLFFTLLFEYWPFGWWELPRTQISRIFLQLVVLALLWLLMGLKAEIRDFKRQWVQQVARERKVRMVERGPVQRHGAEGSELPLGGGEGGAPDPVTAQPPREPRQPIRSTMPPPPIGGGGTSSASWPEGMHAVAVQAIGELETEWRARRLQRAELRQSSGSRESREVADVADRLALVLGRRDEDPVSARNLESLATRLRATSLPSTERDEAGGAIFTLRSLEEWRREGISEERMIEEIGTKLRQTREMVATLDKAEVVAELVNWRSSAEQVLHTLTSHLARSGSEGDSDSLRSLRQRLLELLQWQDIPVHRGDTVNRDLHEVESTRSTTELAPNRVLELISPGYRDSVGGEIVRKAKVVLSQQKLE